MAVKFDVVFNSETDNAKGYFQIASGAVPQVVSGKEAYQEISCQAENGKIVLQFPIYQWIDNYPHCDGEHDRWDTRKVGAHTMIFDACAKTVVCS